MRRIGLIALLWLQACHLGPRYEVPASTVPEEWKGETVETGPTVQYWWEVFEDEELAQLQKELVEKNFDLYSALQKIEEARAVAGIAKSSLYPQASLQPSYGDSGKLIELYGVPPGLFPQLKEIVRVHEMSYQMPLNVRYEVDIWQKYRGTYNAAEMKMQSRQEAYKTLLLSLTSELASHYYNARTLDAQIALLGQKVEAYKELLRLRQLRYLSGVDSYIEVLGAIQQYEKSEAEYNDSVRQRALFENAIAVLVGVPASDFSLEAKVLAGDPPKIPAGLPCSLLTRRPDIAEAERSMAAAQALIGVAYATFFPDLSLTGALGFLSPDAGQFMTWAGRLWEWGAQIFQTVFDGWRRSSYLDGAKALFENEVGAYQQTVVTAFKEVEDALNNLEQEWKQAEELMRVYEAAGKNAELYAKRLESGMANQLDLLSIRLTALQAETQWVNMQGLRYQATIQLIKAIGGSWECSHCD